MLSVSVFCTGTETREHRCAAGLSGMSFCTHSWHVDHFSPRPLCTCTISAPLVVPVSPSFGALSGADGSLPVPHDPLVSRALRTVLCSCWTRLVALSPPRELSQHLCVDIVSRSRDGSARLVSHCQVINKTGYCRGGVWLWH